MVSNTEVVMAYRLLMGREPDNEQVVEQHAARFRDLAELRSGFMDSNEFRTIVNSSDRGSGPGVKPLSWPPARVDAEIPPDQLQRMVERIEREFVYLGSCEPHWSVLTADRYKSANISEHAAEFFASGEEPVNELVMAAARAGVELSHYQNCFELGCGVGRLTIWLATRFRHVTAGDISAAHLEHARAAVARADLNNVSFIHLNEIGLYQDLPAFDVFFSLIVLQHNPPPLMAHILEVVLNKLNPGGIAYFQIPTYLRDYQFLASAYLDSVAPVGDVEVHCVPQPVLFEIIERTGCQVLEIREDAALGEPVISNRLLLKKRGS